MRKSQTIVLIALMIASIAGAAMADTASTSPAGVVNINTADASQLSYLPRVGVKAAQHIIDYRAQHGPFHKTTDLMQVKGFGEKRYNQVSAYVTVDGKTTLTSKISAPRKPRKSASRQTPAPTATE
jgi:competence protein ComEA